MLSIKLSQRHVCLILPHSVYEHQYAAYKHSGAEALHVDVWQLKHFWGCHRHQPISSRLTQRRNLTAESGCIFFPNTLSLVYDHHTLGMDVREMKRFVWNGHSPIPHKALWRLPPTQANLQSPTLISQWQHTPLTLLDRSRQSIAQGVCWWWPISGRIG